MHRLSTAFLMRKRRKKSSERCARRFNGGNTPRCRGACGKRLPNCSAFDINAATTFQRDFTGEVELIDAALSLRARTSYWCMECTAAGFIGWLGLSRRSDTDQG